MIARMSRLAVKPQTEAPNALKRAALQLFAARGIDGVTVREIAKEAGQKNHGALAYYFGSKEALVRELILDGAKIIDDRRNAWLDAMEAKGGPATVREVCDVLIFAAINLSGQGEEVDAYMRFLVSLDMSYHGFFIESLAGRWNSGYQRCLKHLRRLMGDRPIKQKNQRFIFLESALFGVLSRREAGLSDRSRSHPTWSSSTTLDHFSHCLAAMLEAE